MKLVTRKRVEGGLMPVIQPINHFFTFPHFWKLGECIRDQCTRRIFSMRVYADKLTDQSKHMVSTPLR